MARQQQLNFENSTYFESLVANGLVASTIDNTQNAYLIVTTGLREGNRVSFQDAIMSAQDFLSYATGGSYTLPVATSTVLGGVKQGTNVTIAPDGTISASGGGSGSIYTNGFRVTGPLAENITLPVGANVEYTGPLSIAPGYALTIPVGTTLTII